MTFIAIALFVFAAWTLLGAFASIALVGKPRKPSTPGQVAYSVAVGMAFAVVLTIAGVMILS